MMSSEEKLIQAGINYLRTIDRETRSGNRFTVKDLSDDTGIPVESIKRAITAAKEHKAKATKPFTVKLSQPYVKIGRDFATGERQIIDTIEIEVLKPIQVNYERQDYSEFVFMAPIKIRVQRRK